MKSAVMGLWVLETSRCWRLVGAVSHGRGNRRCRREELMAVCFQVVVWKFRIIDQSNTIFFFLINHFFSLGNHHKFTEPPAMSSCVLFDQISSPKPKDFQFPMIEYRKKSKTISHQRSLGETVCSLA